MSVPNLSVLVSRAIEARNERLRKKANRMKKIKKPDIKDGSKEFYDAIRELYDRGFALKDIAKAMGIKYDRLLWIVKKMGLKRKFYQRKVYDAGRGSCGVILPNKYTEELGIKPGDVVYVSMEEGKIIISKELPSKPDESGAKS